MPGCASPLSSLSDKHLPGQPPSESHTCGLQTRRLSGPSQAPSLIIVAQWQKRPLALRALSVFAPWFSNCHIPNTVVICCACCRTAMLLSGSSSCTVTGHIAMKSYIVCYPPCDVFALCLTHAPRPRVAMLILQSARLPTSKTTSSDGKDM